MSDRETRCCGTAKPLLDRRHFLRVTGMTTAGLMIGPGVVAGPFERHEFGDLIPADKKLNAEWLNSLFERGTPITYEGRDLSLIGMPIGGICAGQLYLGGDGRLCYWDIFNRVQRTGVDQYAHPAPPTSPLQQGFAIQVRTTDLLQTRTLDAVGFRNVRFRGEYPVGSVTYDDPDSPVGVRLQAFSPFIPLSTDDSSLPTTIMQFSVSNEGSEPAEIQLGGWLQNLVCPYSGAPNEDVRRNEIMHLPGLTFLNCSAISSERIESRFDHGSMGLGLLDFQAPDRGFAEVSDWTPIENMFLDEVAENNYGQQPFREKLRGALVRKMLLRPGDEGVVTFLLAWNFPNLEFFSVIPGDLSGPVGRDYGNRFPSAKAVAEYVVQRFEQLRSDTLLWRDTWYQSSLPYWFLDRTFANASILATNTCYRLANRRFYAFEGVGCCVGTCTSVWHYAQAVSRLFPALERAAREMQDYGVAFDPGSGGINHRGEVVEPALDGQAGTILRVYREYQMSSDDGFLRRIWPRIKKSTEWLIAADADEDGLIEGRQSTTLDNGNWYGALSWTSSLYLAALRAAEEMAVDMGDLQFAARARAIVVAGRAAIVDRLWNGEYFVHRPDLTRPDGFIIGNGCHADQVLGDSWANQVNLGRILPKDKVESALRALWRYNFTPDVGPYRQVNEDGRWYAMPGEGGLIMTTWPRGDRLRPEANVNAIGTGYLNECWTGFEYQVAGHMIGEGIVQEGLAICRMIHDRYHPSRRNPWNEIECGDHYSRSMASYGVFLAACGYKYHGPKGHLGFAPRIGAEDFRASFTAAEGWGSYRQTIQPDRQNHVIELRWGSLRLRSLEFELSASVSGKTVDVTLGQAPREVQCDIADSRLTLRFTEEIRLMPGDSLGITIS